MTRPDLSRALDGLAMVSDGLRLIDEHFKALPAEGQNFIENSGLQYVDAMSVDRLRAAIRAMEDCHV